MTTDKGSITIGNITNSIAAIGHGASVTINQIVQGLGSLPGYQTKSTRLIRPKITSYISRPRLVQKVTDALAARSVFIHSDAGYGKTWLVHDFITITAPPVAVWYTFDRDPINVLQFVHEIASAWIAQVGSKDSRTLTYLTHREKEVRSDEALAILVEEISQSAQTHLLVLEDLHYVNEPALDHAIESLLIVRPDNLKIILTSRHPFVGGQARLTAQGKLFTIDRADLAFTLGETQECLLKHFKLDIPLDKVQLLQHRTEGLGAAISLAADILRTAPQDVVERLFERLTGFSGNIYEFFAQEVYGGQNDEARWLLKRIGLAQSVKPETADLFTGRSDGGLILREMSQRNSFLIEDAETAGSYRFHALFAEFLQARFQEEESAIALRETHSRLAHHFENERDWYPATQHALLAQEYDLAAQGLERMAPVVLNMGYGYALLKLLDEIPSQWNGHSARLLENEGLAALQAGEIRRALEAFGKAQALYQAQAELTAVNRVQFLEAECRLTTGDLKPEEYVRTTHRIAMVGYERSEILFGAQVELRMIEVGQTISTQYGGLLQQLMERSDKLVARLQEQGKDYNILKARAYAAQAHLLFQWVSGVYSTSLGRLNVRQQLGYPISKDERIVYAKVVGEGLQHVLELYAEAERLAREESEIEWARIRAQHIVDHAHQLSVFHLIGDKLGLKDSAPTKGDVVRDVDSMVQGFLPHLEECAQIFAKYHMAAELAIIYCDAADIYDILGDAEPKEKFSTEALRIAKDQGLTQIAERAARIIRNESTFSSLRATLDIVPGDKELVAFSAEDKTHYVDVFLQAFKGDADIEKMRDAVRSDLEDMVEAAKQRLEWCKHVQIIQDRRHSQSLNTMYQEVPKKWIVCNLLRYRSPNAGFSFAELWPMFKGVYCLGCPHRSLS